jgi:hypothetical protein
MNNDAAISRLVMPDPARSATCCSAGVSSSPASRLSPSRTSSRRRALSPLRGADRLEARQRPLERFAGGAAPVGATLDAPERQQCQCLLDRLRCAAMLLESGVERMHRLVEISLRRVQQAAAASSARQGNGSVEAARA